MEESKMAEMNKREIMDEALENVAGGNNGDTEKEYETHQRMYSVGETVEIFKSGFHWHTTRGVIIEVKNTDEYDYDMVVPCYKVRLENGKEDWYYADDIERK